MELPSFQAADGRWDPIGWLLDGWAANSSSWDVPSGATPLRDVQAPSGPTPLRGIQAPKASGGGYAAVPWLRAPGPLQAARLVCNVTVSHVAGQRLNPINSSATALAIALPRH